MVTIPRKMGGKFMALFYPQYSPITPKIAFS